jgi:hypothetical protein
MLQPRDVPTDSRANTHMEVCGRALLRLTKGVAIRAEDMVDE